MSRDRELLEPVEVLQNICIARATHMEYSNDEYRAVREELMESHLGGRLPRFVRTSTSLDQLWLYMKRQPDNYEDRRQHIYDAFKPLIDQLSRGVSAADQSIANTLRKLDAGSIQDAWRKALERRSTDPEGAITSARTLLETVCKHILDDEDIEYSPEADLPQLYRACAEVLDMAPSQQTAQIFRQIFGGCTSVVQGLGSLRNRVGDAHGHGRHAARPSERHARLAVNLAGSMATFLVETWEADD
jgi:hypothetical protein